MDETHTHPEDEQPETALIPLPGIAEVSHSHARKHPIDGSAPRPFVYRDPAGTPEEPGTAHPLRRESDF